MKSKNTMLIVLGAILAIGAVAGVILLNKSMQPATMEVIMARQDINEGSYLSSMNGTEFEVRNISLDRATGSGIYVTYRDFVSMREDGQFLENITAGSFIKYTDIMSSNNRYSSRQLSLAQANPNLVTMTIDVSGYAPIGIHNGDYVDIIATVSNYNTADAYENDLANLLLEVKQKAIEASQMTQSKAENAVSSMDLMSSMNYSLFGTNNNITSNTTAEQPADQNMFNFSAQNSMLQEAMDKADELIEVTDELRGMLDEWNEFLQLYGTIDVATLQSKFDAGFYLAPISKVLVQGSKVVNVNRQDTTNYDGTSSGRLGAVTSLDVLIPRDAIEWVAMANTAGYLRVAVLSPAANPEGSGPTLGAALQDFIEAFVEDRNNMADNESVVIPSSR